MPEATYRTAPPYEHTNGHFAQQVGRDLGMEPDEDQRAILDVIFAEDPEDPVTPACFEVAVIAPRQNIKTSTLEIAALTDLFVFREPHIWTAHRYDTSQETFQHMRALIDGAPEYRKLCRWPPRTASGSESIELLTGENITFATRSTGGGRGKSRAKLTYDEGLFLDPSDVGATYPVMATFPNAQVRIGSSAGLLTSSVLRSVRDRGRRGEDALGYFEWAAPPTPCADTNCSHIHGTVTGCALDDEALWLQANPALERPGRDNWRISLERMRQFRRSMPPDEFAREFLSWWEDPAEGESGIPPEAWLACSDSKSTRAGRVAFAVDMTPDRSWTAIAVAGLRADGLMHVEVVQHERTNRERLVAELVRLAQTHSATVALDGAGPISALIPDLEKAGVTLAPASTADARAACGSFYDAVIGGTLRHIDQPQLNSALVGAERRDVGDGGWLWSRRKSDVDISPLYAVTLAAWAAKSAGAFFAAGWR